MTGTVPMSHDPHHALAGWHPARILHDGCTECEVRGTSRDLGISALDNETFARAWKRAAAWNRDELERGVSRAETPMLDALWAVQVQLERRGVPIGEVPHGA